ncbi:hypothetical protein L484_022230 [Morus notabilis]|uniref:Uncharacterized protein n=1 Tax=Morus notabilis TaxID=981085 RepID=W9SGJ9_9ROSA|nr:hypothetical protein L484_022230 [Morus notabilis]
MEFMYRVKQCLLIPSPLTKFITSHIQNDDYSMLMSEETDWEVVIHRMTQAGIEWRRTRTGTPKDFPASALTREGKA